ncbi:hypothetical protein GF380_02725 [Candidatus Uhrbacteria bacterium]|nr:hypothetical protein [Candidatus Uhrbacteria bacterium]
MRPIWVRAVAPGTPAHYFHCNESGKLSPVGVSDTFYNFVDVDEARAYIQQNMNEPVDTCWEFGAEKPRKQDIFASYWEITTLENGKSVVLERIDLQSSEPREGSSS